jgi:hypothetical protein
MRLGWALGAGLTALGAAALIWAVASPSGSPAMLPHQRPASSVTEHQPPPSQQVSPGVQWDELAGQDDAQNRYPFTVIVTAHFSGAGERNRACSGVLIAPRLVLTAGDCVCVRSNPSTLESQSRRWLDAATCETSATVKTFTYEPLAEGQGVESWSESYEGVIRPHPHLKLQLDEHGHTVSARANLAVVLLDRPAKKNTPPALLAEEGVRAGEFLIVVGYGYIEAIAGLDGRRRFTQEQVVRITDERTGQARFGQAVMQDYKGDTGGPCLRETPQGPVLVGISHRGSGNEATLTSLKVYRDWLRGEIQRSGEEARSSPPLPLDGRVP